MFDDIWESRNDINTTRSGIIPFKSTKLKYLCCGQRVMIQNSCPGDLEVEGLEKICFVTSSSQQKWF